MEWRDVTLKEQHIRNFLKVQWLGLSAPTAGTGFDPWTEQLPKSSEVKSQIQRHDERCVCVSPRMHVCVFPRIKLFC